MRLFKRFRAMIVLDMFLHLSACSEEFLAVTAFIIPLIFVNDLNVPRFCSFKTKLFPAYFTFKKIFLVNCGDVKFEKLELCKGFMAKFAGCAVRLFVFSLVGGRKVTIETI